MLHFRLPGVRVPHRKNTKDCAPVSIPTPATVTIPMSMHIGAPAVVAVKPGDSVKTGQLIGSAGGYVSSPVYASITGTVKRIDTILGAGGQLIPAVTIQAAEKQETAETVVRPTVTNYDEWIEAVRASGVVGLGGAGFPTAVKLSVKDLDAVEAIVINGAECEPYITSDTQTMLHDSALIIDGIGLLEKYMRAKNIIIAIEKNKPECSRKLTELTRDDPAVTVRALPSVYPQGGEKVLIYHTTGKVVPEGKLPLDAGVIVLNCTTLAAIARYVNTGMPLVEKCVTVDGSCVKKPANVIVPIGTPVREVFEFCGGFTEPPQKLLYGGPMMGVAIASPDAPVLKNTNALLAFGKKECRPPVQTACLHCGRCVSRCPLHLTPCEMERAYDAGNTARLEKLKVNLCMECGCCSYICPAARPLVQKNKLAKAVLRQEAAAKKAREEKTAKEAK